MPSAAPELNVMPPFDQPRFLSDEEVRSVLTSFPQGETITVVRIRYKNKTEIRTEVRMTVDELESLILSSIEEGQQSGGDLEVTLPGSSDVLVGHHDGLYWLERSSGHA